MKVPRKAAHVFTVKETGFKAQTIVCKIAGYGMEIKKTPTNAYIFFFLSVMAEKRQSWQQMRGGVSTVTSFLLHFKSVDQSVNSK